MAEGAAQMTVDFTFTHDGQRWRVRRVFHANTTPSTHLLQNLDTGEQIDNARAVNRRIEALLQLRFDSFTHRRPAPARAVRPAADRHRRRAHRPAQGHLRRAGHRDGARRAPATTVTG